MALSLITNIGALTAANALTTNQLNLNQSIAQLSSGKRIVNASDDPAGLAISIETSGVLAGLTQASANVSNAQALLQTADGGLANIGNALVTAQQLATEAADGSFTAAQLTALDTQFQALVSEIDQIASGTTFNGIQLLDGSVASLTFQIGSTNSTNDQLAVNLVDARATTGTALFSAGAGDLTTQANAQTAIAAVSTALANLAGFRAGIGAAEQQLSTIGANLQSSTQNLTNALSTIQDANIAQTFARFTKQSVLQQAGVQVLRQAQAAPSQLIALLQ